MSGQQIYQAYLTYAIATKKLLEREKIIISADSSLAMLYSTGKMVQNVTIIYLKIVAAVRSKSVVLNAVRDTGVVKHEPNPYPAEETRLLNVITNYRQQKKQIIAIYELYSDHVLHEHNFKHLKANIACLRLCVTMMENKLLKNIHIENLC